MGLCSQQLENLSIDARSLVKAAKIRTPVRYGHSDITTGSSCTLVLAILVGIPEAVALLPQPSGPCLERVTRADHVVGRGAEAVFFFGSICLMEGVEEKESTDGRILMSLLHVAGS